MRNEPKIPNVFPLMLITHKRTRSQILPHTQSVYDSNNDV